MALLVIPNGQLYIAWFALAALVGMWLLSRVGLWYRDHLALRPTGGGATALSPVGRNRVIAAIAILLADLLQELLYGGLRLLLRLLHDAPVRAVSVGSAQLHLFLFLVRWRVAR